MPQHNMDDHTDMFGHDIARLMNEEYGTRLIARMLHEFGLFKSSYTDQHHMAFNEGQRSAALFLTQAISVHCPEKISDIYTQAQRL